MIEKKLSIYIKENIEFLMEFEFSKNEIVSAIEIEMPVGMVNPVAQTGFRNLRSKLNSDSTKISVFFDNLIKPNQKFQFNLRFNPKNEMIVKFGGLKILDLPMNYVNEFIFNSQEQLFFCSALGNFNTYEKRQNFLLDRNYMNNLKNNLYKNTAIRIEWGRFPKISARMRCEVRNNGDTPVYDLNIKNIAPQNTLHQTVNYNLKNDFKLLVNDGNLFISKDIKELRPKSVVNYEFNFEVHPNGNKKIFKAYFGDYKDYENIIKEEWGKKLIQDSIFIDFHTQNIQDLVRILKTHSKSLDEYIKKAFKYVNYILTYKINNKRAKASEALSLQSGDCSEYSDLFIAILRANKIPSRVIHGFVIQKNKKDVEYHSWCEFYSTNFGWIQCDPTWGFLTGVSCQHVCLKRLNFEADIPETMFSYKGPRNTISIKSNIEILNIE